jgi:DNA primase large subunit
MKENNKLNSIEDNASHFLLITAAALNQDFKQWLVSVEMELFKQRMKYGDIRNHQVLLDGQNFNKKKLEELIQENPSHEQWFKNNFPPEVNKDSVIFNEVPIEIGYSQLSKKKFFVQNGYIYIPEKVMQNVYLSVFRDFLEQHISIISDCLPNILKDARIKELLETIVSTRHASNYQVQFKNNAKINMSNIDYYSQKCYPPCMRHLHSLLRAQHKLMHYGRLMYILFLKGIGVSLEDAMYLWRSEFTKVMDSNKFEREYAYNVRHGYGKEGKKADYSPWSCDKIIKFEDTASEPHGCPFKIYNAEGLIKFIDDYKLTQEEMREIMDAKGKKCYQICCLRLWEFTHKGQIGDNIGNHPNAYFDS